MGLASGTVVLGLFLAQEKNLAVIREREENNKRTRREYGKSFCDGWRGRSVLGQVNHQ